MVRKAGEPISFINKLQSKISLIHQQVLCSKEIRMNHVMIINLIIKNFICSSKVALIGYPILGNTRCRLLARA